MAPVHNLSTASFEPSDFPDDVELGSRPSSNHGYLTEQTITLQEFLCIVRNNPRGIGSVKIAAVEIRQRRSWPFYHEYVVLTVYQRGIKWYIKLERFVVNDWLLQARELEQPLTSHLLRPIGQEKR